ncbi:MAG TPA: DUF4142 domain-containing protein [Pyrinomonadaceae bacterium]|nr:DUF4142 domain-containing protein [Pyrinomonadaceae bacterium]
MKKTWSVLVTLTFITACGALAFALAARSAARIAAVGAQNANSAESQQNANVGANANAEAHAGHAAAAGSADERFLAEAAMSGAMEVEMGRLAPERAASEEIKAFARKLVEDHTKANEALAKFAQERRMALPQSLDSKHRKEVDRLAALRGERFDSEFVRVMIKDHKKDIALYEREAARGADAGARELASAILPTLREHLRMVQRIYDKALIRRAKKSAPANANRQD